MDPIQEIQTTIQGVLSIFLLGSGIVISLVGLFLWLGGLRLLRVLAGLSLAGIGFGLAYAFAGGTIPVLAAAVVIAGAVGFVFRKFAGALLGVLTAGLLAVLFFAAPVLMKGEFWRAPPGVQEPDMLTAMNWIQEYLSTLAGRFEEMVRNLPAKATVAGCVCAAAAGLLALLRPLWVAALFTSSLGTAFVAAGLTILLIFKGARPFEYVRSHPQALGLAAGGMVLFGVAVQALLFREKQKLDTAPLKQAMQGDKK